MGDNKRKPDIRFQGFTDDWEQRKLSEIATMHARIGWQNLRTSEFLDQGDYMLITGTDFDDGRINYSTCHYVEKERYEQDPHIQIQNGNILITKDGTLGKVAYVQGLEMPATLNAGVFNVEIRDENYVDGKYIFQYLKAPFLMDYVGQKATGGTIKHLNQNILVDFPVVLPKKAEQEKIGQYFEDIDNLITLQQRKYDKLVNVKKSMLEKMFPREGAKVPEIRFEGFTDDWEQRKLGECFTERKDSMPEGELISVTIGEGIKKFSELGRHDNSNDDKSKYKKVCVGDIAYNSMRMWQGASGYSPYEGIVSPAYTVLSPITDVVDSKCISYLFKRSDMTHVFQINSQGITSDNWNLKYPALSEIEIMVSPYLAEQHKIAAYLSRIDNLITLQQRKLEKLKNIKKSMLEKMFV